MADKNIALSSTYNGIPVLRTENFHTCAVCLQASRFFRVPKEDDPEVVCLICASKLKKVADAALDAGIAAWERAQTRAHAIEAAENFIASGSDDLFSGHGFSVFGNGGADSIGV